MMAACAPYSSRVADLASYAGGSDELMANGKAMRFD
jgi:hypothetical protein